jgi:hypothetical protein
VAMTPKKKRGDRSETAYPIFISYTTDDLTSTVSFLLPVRAPSARWEFTGGRMPVVNSGLFIASQYTTDFLGNSPRPRRVRLQQPREHLMQLRYRQRGRFFLRRPFSNTRNHNASRDSVMW